MSESNAAPITVVILEDDENFATLVQRALEGLADSFTKIDSWTKLDRTNRSEIMWIDLRMPDSDVKMSLDRIKELRSIDAEMIIIVGSGFISPEISARLHQLDTDGLYFKGGQFDPYQVASIVLLAIMRAKKRNPEAHAALLDRALKWMGKRFPEAALVPTSS